MHAHVHIMPRRLGDVQHARGGIRRLLMKPAPVATSPASLSKKPWYKIW